MNDFDKNLRAANPYGYSGGAEVATVRNQVLRNTYWLLAVSMIPTILGAWAGIAFNVATAMRASPGVSMIVFHERTKSRSYLNIVLVENSM